MTREIILSNVEEVGSEEYLVVYRDTAISCRKSVVSLVLTIQFSKCPGLSFHGVIVSSLLPAHLLSGPAPETDPLPRQETLTRTLLPVSGLNLVYHGYIFYV